MVSTASCCPSTERNLTLADDCQERVPSTSLHLHLSKQESCCVAETEKGRSKKRRMTTTVLSSGKKRHPGSALGELLMSLTILSFSLSFATRLYPGLF